MGKTYNNSYSNPHVRKIDISSITDFIIYLKRGLEREEINPWTLLEDILEEHCFSYVNARLILNHISKCDSCKIKYKEDAKLTALLQDNNLYEQKFQDIRQLEKEFYSKN